MTTVSSSKTAPDELLIYTKMVDFLSWLFPVLNTFPKSQRLIISQQISNSALTCLRLIVSARNSRSPRKRATLLFELNVEFECLRKLISVAHDIGFLNAKRTENGTNQLLELGKMCGGWIKRYDPST
jgi:four helix bundle protein